MNYEDIRAFFGVAGLLIFITLFVGVLIYTFWPGNKKRFEQARRIPLDDEQPGATKNDPNASRDDNG